MSTLPYPPVAHALAGDQTRNRLGTAGMSLALRHLWLGDCQTCGRRLPADEPPALVAADYGPFVELSLHHRACRDAAWCDRFIIESEGTSSYLYRPIDLIRSTISPYPQAALLLNPTVERVRLTRDSGDPASPWRLDRPIQPGFGPLSQVNPHAPGDDVPRAVVRRSATHPTVVDVWVRDHKYWECDLGVSGMTQARQMGGLVLVLSNAISPHVLDGLDAIYEFMDRAWREDIADAAWAPLVGP